MSEVQPSQVLADRFEVLGTLGRGGTATVYLARDRKAGGEVALKVLHEHLAHDPSMRRRIEREVVAARLVRHDAALVAHDLHPVGHTLALSMPFHPGTTLTERVRGEGPLGADEVRALGVRLAGALASAHLRGVLHRDVSPNNVMLREAADAVLTDFGLARTRDGATATATGIMGTPGFAAPEVYGGRRTDPRSDLYGLGAVLYFAAAGRAPFGAGAPAAVLAAQLEGEPPSLRTLVPSLPADLADTIDALLRRDPARRPPSAQEVALALRSGRPALVPVVPDTWDAEQEPLLPVPRRPAPPVRAPAALPGGDWQVVVTGRRGCDARTLADNVGGVVGLAPGALEITRPMRTRKNSFLLFRPTDEPSARRLAEAARTAGYGARVVDIRPPSALQRMFSLAPLLIPLIWIAFPFYTMPALGLQLALVLSIGASILLPALTAPFARQQVDADLPQALGPDLARHLVTAERPPEDVDDLDEFIDGLGLPDFLRSIAHEFAADGDVRQFALGVRRGFLARTRPPVRTAQGAAEGPAGAPAPAQPTGRSEDLRGRALGNLDLLSRTLDEVEGLPDVARADLARTTQHLRERAEQLARTAVGLEAALAETPEAEDVSWIHGRLTRLETLTTLTSLSAAAEAGSGESASAAASSRSRAGGSRDDAERERLLAALRTAEAASEAREELESRLTATLAQLLEIGAVATRARADLLGLTDVPTTARQLTGQLREQVEAVDQARRELSTRRMASRVAE